MRVYISGAITKAKDPDIHFSRAEQDLINLGHTPFNPERIGAVVQNAMHWRMEYEDFMALDEIFLRQADAIYMLKGYEHSNGARHELMEAVKLGKIVMYEEKLP